MPYRISEMKMFYCGQPHVQTNAPLVQWHVLLGTSCYVLSNVSYILSCVVKEAKVRRQMFTIHILQVMYYIFLGLAYHHIIVSRSTTRIKNLESLIKYESPVAYQLPRGLLDQ